MTDTDAIENLAVYLVNERRYVDAMLNQGCDPLNSWEEASDGYRDSAREVARLILAGKHESNSQLVRVPIAGATDD